MKAKPISIKGAKGSELNQWQLFDGVRITPYTYMRVKRDSKTL
jgi:hypothetical protein